MERKVRTVYLKRGMYVSGLDRPWLDTPFLLQGFTIQNDEDLETLRQYCEYVYIDGEFKLQAHHSTSQKRLHEASDN